MPARKSKPRDGLLEIAKLVADDLKRGQSSPTLHALRVDPTNIPTVAFRFLDLLLAESDKKRPSENLLHALLVLIGRMLEEARFATESDADSAAATVVSELRAGIAQGVEAGRVSAVLLMALAQQFAAAKLDIGDELRAVALELAEEEPEPSPDGPADLAAQFVEIAEAFDNDPFLIHGQLSEQLAAFPGEHQGVIVAALAVSDAPAMREAALGWLLDRDPAVSGAAAQSLAAAAARGQMSHQAADRLVVMRPWLPSAIQPDLDAAVRAMRQRGGQPEAKPAPQIAAALASGCDGAGAQTFFVILKRGRKLALASLLIKHGFGIRDAWVRDDLSRKDIDQFVHAITMELDPFDASPEIVGIALANGLAVGLERNEPPTFGLVQFLEGVGLSTVRPERLDTAALLAHLLEAAPAERKTAKAVTAALAGSTRWPEEHVFAESWFEPDDAARAAAASARGKKQRQQAILERVLPERRGRWAELLAWTAKAAQDQDEDDIWIDFALVARELAGERPLGEIPIARWIAENTLDALAAR